MVPYFNGAGCHSLGLLKIPAKILSMYNMENIINRERVKWKCVLPNKLKQFNSDFFLPSVENQIWMLWFLIHLWDLFMSHSWMHYMLYLYEQTHIRKNQFHYLDRCMFVSIWKNISPASYKHSVILLKNIIQPM